MIIVTFTDFKYLDIFNIFYDHFVKLQLPLNLLVVCLDKEIHNELNSRDIKTMYKPYNINGINNFWEFRLHTINEIFKKHKNYLRYIMKKKNPTIIN